MKKNKSIYWFGFLCLIPLLGIFAGIILIILWVFKYKDRLLVVIGSIGIIFTVTIYSFLFYQLRSGHVFDKPLIEVTQKELNRVVKNIEFYKVQNGKYPDSIGQLRKMDSTVMIDDPMLARKVGNNGSTYFQYYPIGQKYTVFSVGLDKIPNTNDDLYPTISSLNIGLIIIGR